MRQVGLSRSRLVSDQEGHPLPGKSVKKARAGELTEIKRSMASTGQTGELSLLYQLARAQAAGLVMCLSAAKALITPSDV